ncbi:hypothetical protein Taro_055431 [Colocasia esculenta]|uniref:Retrotransposon gag domain-containing protein n=1 Tax=Colocasia esculenta TaxID=4460 RepID=A0A843XTM1_COLES|nr:hypothetical protein [Colocasia esculenta]
MPTEAIHPNTRQFARRNRQSGGQARTSGQAPPCVDSQHEGIQVSFFEETNIQIEEGGLPSSTINPVIDLPTRENFQTMSNDDKYQVMQQWQSEMATLLNEMRRQSMEPVSIQNQHQNQHLDGSAPKNHPTASTSIQVADLYSVPYPVHHKLKKLPLTCRKVPKLQKFDGHGSPLEHVAHYITAMGDLALEESYLLRYFATSLTRVAFQWYSKLKSNSVADWADLQKKFINRFQTAERKVSLAELCSLKQKKGESAIDFIKRWREFSMKCDNLPAQEDAITICRRGLTATINEKLLGANIRSFDQLNSIVAEIEMFLAEQMAHTSHKGKLPKKRNPPGKEVNVIDFSPEPATSSNNPEAGPSYNPPQDTSGAHSPPKSRHQAIWKAMCKVQRQLR